VNILSPESNNIQLFLSKDKSPVVVSLEDVVLTPVFIYIFFILLDFVMFWSEYLCIRTVWTYFPLHVYVLKTNNGFDHNKGLRGDGSVVMSHVFSSQSPCPVT